MSDINRDGHKLYADLQQKLFGLGNLSIAYCYSKIFKTVFLFQNFSFDDIENVENIKKYEKSYVVFLKT